MDSSGKKRSSLRQHLSADLAAIFKGSVEEALNLIAPPPSTDARAWDLLKTAVGICIEQCVQLTVSTRYGAELPLAFLPFSASIDPEALAKIRTSLSGAAPELAQLPGNGLACLYEQILQLRPCATARGEWQLLAADKARKPAGTFYTPDVLAALVVERTLKPLTVAEGAASTPLHPDALLSLKVVDPAMGGGSFLVAALRYLSGKLQQSAQFHALALTAQEARLAVLVHCLHGVDLDPVAVRLCLLTLLLECSVPPANCTQALAALLQEKFLPGNSLIGAWTDLCPQPHDREHMDLWCARFFGDDSEDLHALAQKHQFFHWQLEFAEVFACGRNGFDAVIGNPPWEIHKPNSREFFARYDPHYWQYGKQQALSRQNELFVEHPHLHQIWCDYQQEHKRFRKWITNCGRASARDGTVSDGMSACSRPFRFQGAADISAYKLFLEQAHNLLRQGGCLGFLVPSGIYSDLGALPLRELFLTRCQWLAVVGLENRTALFDIHRSFKFCLIAVRKGGSTLGIAASFRLGSNGSLEEFFYPTSTIKALSPRSLSLYEFESRRDLELLERISSQTVTIADGDWQIEFEREFDMTNDSNLFHPRVHFQDKGYVQDQYGHWLRGDWRLCTRAVDAREQPEDLLISADGAKQIAVAGVEHMALPLYEGRMVGQFDFTQKSWISGKGRRAVWTEQEAQNRSLSPQYLLPLQHYRRWHERLPLKCGFLAVGSSTNVRSMIASAIDNLPCGNSVLVFKSESTSAALHLVALLNSFVFDFALRCRLTGNNLNFFLVSECPLPHKKATQTRTELALLVAALNLNHVRFSQDWLPLCAQFELEEVSWAATVEERLVLRAIIDVCVAQLYGVALDDLEWLLRGCRGSNYTAAASKGFYRMDKQRAGLTALPQLTLTLFRWALEHGTEELLHCARRWIAGDESALPAALARLLPDCNGARGAAAGGEFGAESVPLSLFESHARRIQALRQQLGNFNLRGGTVPQRSRH